MPMASKGRTRESARGRGGSSGGAGSRGASGRQSADAGRGLTRDIANDLAIRRPIAIAQSAPVGLDPELMRVAQKAAWRAKVGRLWQMPMLVFSVALFGVAAWLFIDPKPGLTIDQKIATAETFL